VGHFCNIQETAQSKQSPIGLKFAQSGHPARDIQLFPNKKKTRATVFSLWSLSNKKKRWNHFVKPFFWTSIYNASVVKINSATYRMARF
jgi:hypothetical protein